MGFFTKGKNSGLLDDRRKDVKTLKKVVKIATLGIVDTTGKKKNSSILSKKSKLLLSGKRSPKQKSLP